MLKYLISIKFILRHIFYRAKGINLNPFPIILLLFVKKDLW